MSPKFFNLCPSLVFPYVAKIKTFVKKIVDEEECVEIKDFEIPVDVRFHVKKIIIITKLNHDIDFLNCEILLKTSRNNIQNKIRPYLVVKTFDTVKIFCKIKEPQI